MYFGRNCLTNRHGNDLSDLTWAIAIALTMIDTLQASLFLTLSLRIAIRRKDNYQISRATLWLATHESTFGYKKQKYVASLLDSVKLDAPDQNQYLKGLGFLSLGISSYFLANWGKAQKQCAIALEHFQRHCHGVGWEISTGQAFELWAMFFSGQIRDIEQKYEELIDDANYKQDILAKSNITNFAGPHVWLARDRPSEAIVVIDNAMQFWPSDVFYVQHFTALAGRVQTLLYSGHIGEAFEAIETSWKRLRASLFLHVEAIRIFMWQLRGRCAASAFRNQIKSKKSRGVAIRAARVLAKEKAPWARPMADSINACIELSSQNLDKAKTSLEHATNGFRECNMQLYQAATAAKLCELIGDVQSERFCKTEAWFRSQNIVNASAMTSLYYPV